MEHKRQLWREKEKGIIRVRFDSFGDEKKVLREINKLAKEHLKRDLISCKSVKGYISTVIVVKIKLSAIGMSQSDFQKKKLFIPYATPFRGY